MVKQNEASMNLSRKPKSEYEFSSYIDCGGLLPTAVTVRPTTLSEISGDPEITSTDADSPGWIISGTLGEKLDVAKWREPPHLVFANLRVDDPQSVKSFIERYGVLLDVERHEKDPLCDTGFRTGFSTDTINLGLLQERLQRAWEDEMDVLDMEGDETTETNIDVTSGFVYFRTKDLWAFIRFLFERDYQAGKLGVCANPDCPARYFRKKRRTQKYCEAGPCTQFAQQQYSLDWWNRIGNKRRLERLAKRTKGKRREKR